jgi:hypothetical protein
MRRHRNPPYAPESLERKLNPSGITAFPVAAEINTPNSPTSISVSPPSASIIVSMDRFEMDRLATVTVLAAAKDPVPTEPGDPEPVGPYGPTGGTDPAPPPGDGTPPVDPPSIPSGPGEPAAAH